MTTTQEARQWLTERQLAVNPANVNRVTALMAADQLAASGSNATPDRIAATGNVDRMLGEFDSRSNGTPARASTPPAQRASAQPTVAGSRPVPADTRASASRGGSGIVAPPGARNEPQNLQQSAAAQQAAAPSGQAPAASPSPANTTDVFGRNPSARPGDDPNSIGGQLGDALRGSFAMPQATGGNTSRQGEPIRDEAIGYTPRSGEGGGGGRASGGGSVVDAAIDAAMQQPTTIATAPLGAQSAVDPMATVGVSPGGAPGGMDVASAGGYPPDPNTLSETERAILASIYGAGALGVAGLAGNAADRLSPRANAINDAMSRATAQRYSTGMPRPSVNITAPNAPVGNGGVVLSSGGPVSRVGPGMAPPLADVPMPPSPPTASGPTFAAPQGNIGPAPQPIASPPRAPSPVTMNASTGNAPMPAPAGGEPSLSNVPTRGPGGMQPSPRGVVNRGTGSAVVPAEDLARRAIGIEMLRGAGGGVRLSPAQLREQQRNMPR